MLDHDRTLIAVNRVRAQRADSFEDWLRAVVVPAAEEHQPHLAGRWHVLRGTETEDGVVVFAFLFDGGTDDDWELRPLLEKAHGPQGADRELAEMREMLAQDQEGWWFTPVRLEAT